MKYEMKKVTLNSVTSVNGKPIRLGNMTASSIKTWFFERISFDTCDEPSWELIANKEESADGAILRWDLIDPVAIFLRRGYEKLGGKNEEILSLNLPR